MTNLDIQAVTEMGACVYDSDGVYMSSAQALAKFGDNVVKYFDGNTIYIL